MPDPTTFTALPPLAEVPAITDVFALDDTSAGATKSILAQFVRTLAGQAITASGSHALAPLQAFVFTDTTARAITFTGAPAYGWLLIIAAQATATSHTAQLPAGVTYDGTNNLATLNGAGDVLILLATSATRYLILYNNSVTLSAV
jgi:hypothetical protein